jgi:hypothetical protein
LRGVVPNSPILASLKAFKRMTDFEDPLQSTSGLATQPRPIKAVVHQAQESLGSFTPTQAWPTPKPSSDVSLSTAIPDALIEQVCQASSQGDLETLEGLLLPSEASTDVISSFTLANAVNKTSGLTPLHYAASRGRLDAVELLLERGALIMEDPSGETAVHLAALKGHLQALKALIEAGGKEAAEAQDSDGWTPLHNACSKGFLDCVRYLVEDVGVPVDALSKARYTPLMNAAGKGSSRSAFRSRPSHFMPVVSARGQLPAVEEVGRSNGQIHLR